MSLEQYGVRKRDSQEEGIPLSSLLDSELLLSIIRSYGEYLRTDSLAIAGSLFIKRYAVLTAAASLYYYGIQEHKGEWWTTAQFDAASFTLLVDDPAPCEIDYDWKEKVFAQHLTPMLQSIAKLCKINERILWENIAVRINSVFREFEETISCQQLDAQCSILRSESPAWIGRDSNPLAIYIHRKFIDKANPKRKTCCRYYEISTSTETPYCYVCPLWKQTV